MPNSSQDWFAEIQPLRQEIDTEMQQRIQKNVQERLNKEPKQEEIIMKKTIKRKIKPLILVAAIIGIGGASLITANAATDGEIITKIKFFVNGHEFEGRLIEELDDGTLIYSGTPENQDENSESILSYSVAFSEDEDIEDVVVEFESAEAENFEISEDEDIEDVVVEFEGAEAENFEIMVENEIEEAE